MNGSRPPRPPGTERLDPAAVRTGEPFTVLYGPGVGDVFVDSTAQVCSMEQALWRMLRSAGFERIVFSTLSHPVYFRDRASRGLSRRPAGRTEETSGRRGAPSMRHTRLRGPLGGTQLLGSARRSATQAPTDPGPSAGTTPASGIADPFGVMTLAAHLRSTEHRTAVVFPHAEEFLLHNQASRQLAGAMAEWAADTVEGNQWILLFNRGSLAEVADFLREFGRYPQLETFVKERRDEPARGGTFRVGLPQAAELERLVHSVRLRQGLRVEWQDLDRVVRAAAGQPEKTRIWHERLRQLSAEGEPLSGDCDAVRRWLGGSLSDERTPWERLAAMPGMEALVRRFQDLRARMEKAEELRARGLSTATEPPARHLVFSGNPGTGKTTVARLLGEMYRDLGVLSRGHSVEPKSSELVAGFVGQSAQQTDAVVDRALDGVLFIDEAYALSDQRDGFGNDVMNTLIKRMEDDRGRLVVIAAGYSRKMKEFLQANEGFSSRFSDIVEFPDYDPATLYTILLGFLGEQGLRPGEEAAHALRQVVEAMHSSRDEGFGNAREMRTLADAVFTRWAVRVGHGDVEQPVLVDDIPEKYQDYLPRPAPELTALLSEFDRYIGLGSIRRELEALVNRLKMRQELGTQAFAPPHMLFTGPPGTGKTSVARLTGKVFRETGLLRKGHVVEVTRTDLVAEYVGQTAPRVRDAVKRALDGVLFIDEAYTLVRDTGGHGGFGAEAVDTLLREMENWRGRLVVIAAGYPQDMERLLGFNDGLRSRFTTKVPFPEYSPEELMEILRRMAAAEGGYTLAPGTAEHAVRQLWAIRQARPDSFGNAREVRKLLEHMEGRKAARWDKGDKGLEYLPEDVPDPSDVQG